MILKGQITECGKKQNQHLKAVVSNKMANNKSGSKKQPECPLCQENFEFDDRGFLPCACGYKVCRFCWHRIRTNENNLCPQCRRPYSENPAAFQPLTAEEIAKFKNEEKKKEMKKRKEIAESRKQLENVRVVQKNLVFVNGLPAGITTQDEKYRQLQLVFKEFGPVLKCILNSKTTYAGSQPQKSPVYVTYQRVEDALRAFKSLPSKIVDFDIQTSLGTTKYCSNFIKNVHCPKQDCIYLHECADEELCFTKDQIQAGEHIQFANRLYEKLIAAPHTRPIQNSQPKDPVVSEDHPLLQEVEPKLKIESKDDISTPVIDSSHNPKPSDTSPQQSKLQKFFTNKPETEEHESLLKEQHQDPNHIPSSLLHARTNGEMSLYEESTSSESANTQQVDGIVNSNVAINDVKSMNIIGLPGKLVFEQSNNRFISSIKSDHLLNDINSASLSLGNLSLNHSANGVSTSISSRSKTIYRLSDDLGFDPFTEASNVLQSEMKKQIAQKHVHLVHHLQQQHQMRSQPATQCKYQSVIQRQKNPPPGFTITTVPSEPQPSPAYDTSSNILIQRMSPNSPVALSLQNAFNKPSRPVVSNSYQGQRFQQSLVPLNSNPIMNGYSAPIRNIQPQLPVSNLRELLARTMANAQQIPNQAPNIQQTQYVHSEQSLPSSYFNVNQAQWMQAENTYQSQNMQEFNQASPLLHRRMQPQIQPPPQQQQIQQRPLEYSRQIPQTAIRFNPSPFPDNNQYIFPSAQNNQQQHKDVLFP